MLCTVGRSIMKNSKRNVSIFFLIILLGVTAIISCDQEPLNNPNIGLKSLPIRYEVIEECLLANGDSGEIVELNIYRDLQGNVFVTTQQSNDTVIDRFGALVVSQDIANDSDIVRAERSIEVDVSVNKYYFFTVSIANPIVNMYCSLNTTGGMATATCTCGSSGSCEVKEVIIPENPHYLKSTCTSDPTDPCLDNDLHVLDRCKWKDTTTPTPTPQTKSTLVIIHGNSLTYNQVVY